MSKSIKNFNRSELGYYINYIITGNSQPFQIIGTYSENQTETPNAPYLADEWFLYITGLSKNKRPIIDGNTLTFANNDISIIDDYIINNYSRRNVFSDDFISWCDYDYKPSGADVISAPLIFQKIMRARVRALFENKREEYIRLWEIQTSDYNPLYDFDYTERETHTGTDTTAHTGTDTTAHTGTDTTAHSGKDTTQNSGTDTTTRTGSQTLAHSGNDTVADSGSDTNTASTYAFDSVAEVNKDKNVNSYGKSTQTTFNDSETTTYNNLADATAHGLKTELTHGESVSTTHGESVSTTHGESVGFTHGEIISKTKSGSNLAPTDLLKKHRAMWSDFNFLGMVAEDVVKTISV